MLPECEIHGVSVSAKGGNCPECMREQEEERRTQPDLADILDRHDKIAAAATPGPWVMNTDGYGIEAVVVGESGTPYGIKRNENRIAIITAHNTSAAHRRFARAVDLATSVAHIQGAIRDALDTLTSDLDAAMGDEEGT